MRHENGIYISMRMIDMQGNGRFRPLDKIFGGASRNGFEARKVLNWEMELLSAELRSAGQTRASAPT